MTFANSIFKEAILLYYSYHESRKINTESKSTI